MRVLVSGAGGSLGRAVVARYHATAGAISTVALRLRMIVPETFERYGFRLLFGGVDDRDVATSVVLALQHRPQDASTPWTSWPTAA